MRRREFMVLVGGTAASCWPTTLAAQQAAKVYASVFSGTVRPHIRKPPKLFAKGFATWATWRVEHRHRVPVGGGEARTHTRIGGGTRSAQGRCHHCTKFHLHRGGETGDLDDPHRLHRPRGPARQRPCGEPRAAGRQRHRVLRHDDRDSVKGLELLKEAVPGLARVAVIFDPATPSHGPALKAVDAAGPALGLQVQSVAVRSATEFDSAFSAIVKGADAVLVLTTPLFVAGAQQLAELALRHKLPSVFGPRYHVEAGGLMSYSPNRADYWRRGAIYVDKILKGAQPGRSAGPAADQVRAGRQSQDGPGARPRHSAIAPRPRRRGH